jgi:hypothetical protein
MSTALIQSGLPQTFGGMIEETKYIPAHVLDSVNSTSSVTIDGTKKTTAIIKMAVGTGGTTGNVWFQKAAQNGKFTIENNYARNTTTDVETTTPQLSLTYDGTNTGMCVNGPTASFGLPNTVTIDGNATLTGAQVRQGLIVSNPGGATTLTLPAITDVFPATLFSNVVAGMFVDVVVHNINSTNTATVAVSATITSDGGTISKLAVVPFGTALNGSNQQAVGRFRIVVTAATSGVPTAGKIYAV